VPLLEACGSIDPLLGRYALTIETLYQQFGGRVTMMIKEGAGHHPHSLRNPKPIADFVEQSFMPATGTPPGFVGTRFTKTCYYGLENSFVHYPEEETRITAAAPVLPSVMTATLLTSRVSRVLSKLSCPG